MENFLPKSQIQNEDLINCLIIGGAGFIGSYVCESLINQGCYVYCLDNYSSGSRQNISNLIPSSNFEMIHTDINNIDNINFERKIDYVFYLAGTQTHSQQTIPTLDVLSVNSEGVKKALEIAVKNNAKFLLCSSENVDDYFSNNNNNLNNYFGLNKSIQEKNLFLEAKKFSEAITAEYVSQKNLDARIVRLGFVYGPRMNFEKNNILSQIILGSFIGKVDLPSDGMGIIYPTYVVDICMGIIKAMFSQSSKNKLYGLLNPNLITLIQLTQLLQEIVQKNTNIVFSKKNIEERPPLITQEIIRSQESLGWTPNTNLRDGLIQTINWIRATNLKTPITPKNEKNEKNIEKTINEEIKDQKTQKILKEIVDKNDKQKQPALTIQPSVVSLGFIKKIKLLFTKKEKKHFREKILVGLGIILILFIVFVSPSLLLNMLVVNNLEKIEKTSQNVKRGEIAIAQKNIQQVEKSGKTISILKDLTIWQKQFFGINLSNQTNKYTIYSSKTTESLKSIIAAYQELGHLIDSAFGKETANSEIYYQKTLSYLTNANENLGYLVAENTNDEIILEKDIKEFKNQVETQLKLIKTLPELLAFQDKKIFLILFQDNNELRPTGGFIEGLGLLTVEKGKIIDFQTMDVYSTDKLLKGVVEPPEEIKKYLGENEWRLYDSNFDPNFPLSAARAAWFIEKQLNITPSGVIAMNLDTFENILNQTGSIFLPEYNENITGENLKQRALKYSQINFIKDGSENKNPFIVNLANHFYEKIKAMQKDSLISLSSIIYNQFEEKNLLIWVPTLLDQNYFAQQNWDGSLKISPTQLVDFGTIDNQDFFAIFNSNFGFNKANYYIQSTTKHNINIGENGEISHNVNLVIQNTSNSESWPGGTYKDYIRFYISPQTIVNSLKISKNINSEFENINAEDIVIKIENYHKSIGYYLEIPPQQTRVIELNFTSQSLFPTKNSQANYLLYVQKQPGNNMLYDLTINHPSFLTVKKINQNPVIAQGKISISDSLDKDKVIAISFSR